MAFLSFGVSWPNEESSLNIFPPILSLLPLWSLFLASYVPYTLFSFLFGLLMLAWMFLLRYFSSLISLAIPKLLVRPSFEFLNSLLYFSVLGYPFFFIDLTSFVNSPCCHLFSWTHLLRLFWNSYSITPISRSFSRWFVLPSSLAPSRPCFFVCQLTCLNQMLDIVYENLTKF